MREINPLCQSSAFETRHNYYLLSILVQFLYLSIVWYLILWLTVKMCIIRVGNTRLSLQSPALYFQAPCHFLVS